MGFAIFYLIITMIGLVCIGVGIQLIFSGPESFSRRMETPGGKESLYMGLALTFIPMLILSLPLLLLLM